MKYFKIAWRNIIKHKGYSLIYAIGLAIGITVSLLDGLWINDELSFNKSHRNYDRIAQVMQHNTLNGERFSLIWNPFHLGEELRKDYGSDFKYVVMSSYPSGHPLEYEQKILTQEGNYMDADAPAMLSLQMEKGSIDGLKDPYSILLSASVAKAFFGNDDPMNKLMKIENRATVKVTGVYKDIPFNSDFKSLGFIAPWQLYLIIFPETKNHPDPWHNNNFLTYVQIADNRDMASISARIKDLKRTRISKEEASLLNPEMFLHPMSKWHLYEAFKNGVNTGGRIEFVWLFGIIGVFVLLLACINFINLSTARAQTRAMEIGIRKTIGSLRWQLAFQFFIESLLIVFFAFVLAVLLVLLVLPFINQVADKQLSIPWANPLFYVYSFVFCLITGLIAGLYPSLYLSSLQPIKVLKGKFKVGQLAVLQRKALVVLQFTVSIILIIGTVVVFRQVQFARDRHIGYNPENLVMMPTTAEIHTQFNAFRNELKSSGAVLDVAESANPTTDFYVSDGRFNWEGKDPNLALEFPVNNITHDYGKTIGWTIKEGRDFSPAFPSDSSAFILNEAAVKFMGLKQPIGKTIEWNGRRFQVIGVVEDIVFESPYQPVRPYIFQMTGDQSYVVTMKLNPALKTSESLDRVDKIFRKFNPGVPFDYRFVDREYARKFGEEERIGKLASFFAILAIFISCLGIFGLAIFIAEQRIKEIGVRKVLGSSVMSIWLLLSKDFVKLVMISFLIASPLAYYFMHQWLQDYEYRAGISWWVFALAGLGLLLITLLTVSYHALKAAMTNPIVSLRTE
jgi:putative ABC transport system permease protein